MSKYYSGKEDLVLIIFTSPILLPTERSQFLGRKSTRSWQEYQGRGIEIMKQSYISTHKPSAV